MRSHRLQRSVRLMLISVIALCVMGIALSNRRGAEVAEITIVDFSKKPYVNPYQSLYEKLLYPTVRIKAGFATGSGVVIDDYILTAAHVVGDETSVIIETFYPEQTEIEATVIITDTIKDLALIKPSRKPSYSARLAPKSYTPYIFTPVYTVGCSLGFTPRPSAGIISVIEKDYWEVSSPILPGNSGGPVYALVPSDDDSHAASRGGNARTYEVIGIAVWVHTHQGQLVTTMAGIVPIGEIYEFLKEYTDLTD
ncbi:MAG: trypsin-like peptidase domain-containing protein [Planctomycetes bacterium]|nr:trypsin-like peptidase domain-containing protein [Planctomycetota bacterium]